MSERVVDAAERRPGADDDVARRRAKGRRQLLWLVLVCLAPVVASYLAYYAFPPSGRTNYGDLVDPQRPVPALATTVLQPGDAPATVATDGLAALRGRWILLAVDGGGCDVRCAEKLFLMRQTQVAMGRERERVAQVLLLTDETPVVAALREAHPDMVMLRVPAASLAAWLPLPAGGALPGHVYLVDPLQHLMMRYRVDPDPASVRKDLLKLLKASRIG